MPVYRSADGKIVEEPTVKNPDNSGSTNTGAPGQHAQHPAPGLPNLGLDEYDIPTTPTDARDLNKKDDDHDPATQINLGGRRKKKSQSTSRETSDADSEAGASEFMNDPVVGWLAVISGPGKGSASTLGIGVNEIGRSKDLRVSLDYGDSEISREGHASVTYDPRGRKYYVQHVGGKNLTYLNDKPVLQPHELTTGMHLSLGQTTLRFVALCDENFDWSELDGSDE